MVQHSRLISVVILIASFIGTGCLTYERMRIEIFYNEDLSEGQITISFFDVNSSEQGQEGREKDFDELRQMVDGNDLYFDGLKQGIYVQEIKLWKENRKLNGSYSGIFRQLNMDDQDMKIQNNERLIIIKKESGDRINTNARVIEDEQTFELIWPTSERRIWYEIIRSIDQPVYSLVPLYDKWQKE